MRGLLNHGCICGVVGEGLAWVGTQVMAKNEVQPKGYMGEKTRELFQ